MFRQGWGNEIFCIFASVFKNQYIMNEIVAKFIEEQKKIQKVEKLNKRKEHLLKLGLIDEKKATKKYSPFDDADSKPNGYTLHDEKGWFKYVSNDDAVIDVTDEEYEEICKICPPIENIAEDRFQKELLDKTDSIRMMVKFFVVLTVIGMVCGFILALVAMSKGSSYSYY